MRAYFLLFFFTHLVASPFEDVTPSSPEEIASLSSNLLIEGFVSPLSGQVSLSETDLIVRGAQDLRLSRNYSAPRVSGSYSGDEKKDRFYLAKALLQQRKSNWSVLPHLWAGFNPNSPNFLLCDPNGSVLEFEIKGSKGVLKTPSYGMSNLRNEEPNAAADPRNIEFVIDARRAHITWPDGTERIYRRIGALLFRLEKELLPNGKAIRYEYGAKPLVKVIATDVSGSCSYASLDWVEGDHYVGSDGREVHFGFERKEVKGKIKHEHASVFVSFLKKVQNPSYTHSLGYNERSLLSFYDAKAFPVSFDYSQTKGIEARVTKFSTPSSFSLFSYDPPVAGKKGGSTTVTCEDGAVKVYRFNQALLLTAVENWFNGVLVNQKTFSYNDRQHICSIETRNGSGQLLIATRYECDSSGNPLVERIEGDFGSFSIRRSFSRNRLLKEEREDGLGIEYTYLGNSHLITSKIVLDQGVLLRTTTYRYDEANNLIEEAEVGHTKISYTLYQKGPYLHRVEWKEKSDWDGALLEKVHHGYDQWGNLSEERYFGSDGQLAYVIQRTFNAKGELLDETNPLGQKAHYEYDLRGRCIHETPFSKQLTITRTFDAKGRLTFLKEGDHGTHYSYNASDELIEKKDYLGFSTRYSYDPVHGKPIRIEAPPTLTQIRLDAFGREVERVDAQGAKTQKKQNSYGDLVELINPDGGKETYSYASNGRILSYTNPDGLKTSYEHDVLGRLLSKREGELLTTYRYDAYHLLEEKDPLKMVTAFCYDLAGRKIEERRADRVTRFGYDSLGFLAWESRENRRISYLRDVLGRPLKKSIDGVLDTSWTYDPSGAIATTTSGEEISSFKHDAYGRLIEKTDPEGNKTRISFLEGNQLLTKRIEDPRGVVTVEKINPHGLLLKRTIGNQIVEEFGYDSALRLTSQDHLAFAYTPGSKRACCTEAGVRTTRWSYTPGGKVLTKQKPDGSLLNYQNDSQGRLAKLEDREFRYDGLDRLIGGSGFTRQLDAFGNLVREEWSNGLWIESKYDDWNRPLERRLCDQSRIVYEYEGPFMKRVLRYDGQGTFLYAHTYHQRDARGCVLSESGLFLTLSTYNRKGAKIFQTNPYFQETIAYDPAGNVVRRGAVAYAYDEASQVTSESEKFTARYDQHRNCIEKNGSPIAIDALNQLQDAAYDANGNLCKPGFVYDVFDQLIEAEGERSVYDALGRRIAKGDTSYLYIGNEEIAAFENGICKELKILGDGGIVAIEIDGQAYAPVQDVQGTIRLLVDWKTGQVVQRNDCDSFGVGLTGEIPYAYAGKRADAKTGLIYFGQRYYDPSLGRWLSRDPLWEVDHSNLYQYVFNNPFRYQDPTGQFTFMIPLLIWGAELAIPALSAYTGYAIAGAVTGAIVYGGYKVCESLYSSGRVGYTPNYTSEFGYLDENTMVWKNDDNKRHTPDQEALSDLVKGAGKKGVSNADADTLLDWAKEYDFPHRDDRGEDHWEHGEHIHVGQNKHIKVN